VGELMINDIKKVLNEMMSKTLDSLKYQLSKVRTGRASVSVLDGIMVDYYGTPTPIKQVGQVSTPEANKTLVKSFGNIPSVATQEVRELNPMSVLNYKYLVLTDPKKSVEVLEGRASKK